jgi:hypothetical protein
MIDPSGQRQRPNHPDTERSRRQCPNLLPALRQMPILGHAAGAVDANAAAGPTTACIDLQLLVRIRKGRSDSQFPSSLVDPIVLVVCRAPVGIWGSTLSTSCAWYRPRCRER